MNVIDGDNNTWDALIYGEKSPSLINYFYQKAINLPTTLLDVSKSFYANTVEIFNTYNSDDVLKSVRNILKNGNNLFHSECIRPLLNSIDIQTSNLTMQRWIMSNPSIRQSFFDQKLDGYSETYRTSDETIGINNYDYRRATNNIVYDHHEIGLSHIEFFEDLKFDDRELDFSEQISVINTWELAELMLKEQGDDPTSRDGGKL